MDGIGGAGGEGGSAGEDGQGGEGGDESPIAPVRRLQWRMPPASGSVGQPLGELEIEVVDGSGDRVLDYEGEIELEIAAGPSGAQLQGETRKTFYLGRAHFDDLSLSHPGTYTLLAHAEDLDPILSPPFTIRAGAARHLVFQRGPFNVTSLQAMAPAVEVAVLDEKGNLVTDARGTMRLELSEDSPAGAYLEGGEAQVIDGVATFEGLRLDLAGSYMFIARFEGLVSRPSPSFLVLPGPPHQLAFVEEPASHLAGEHFGAAVEVRDEVGNFVSAPVEVALSLVGDGGVLEGKTTRSSVNGLALFDGLRVLQIGQNYQLRAVADGVEEALSQRFHVHPGEPTSIVWIEGPQNAAVGEDIGPVVVEVRDLWGNPIPSFHGQITLSLHPAAPSGVTLSGSTSLPATGGRATFSPLHINRPGTGYQLLVESDGLGPFASTFFDVRSGNPHRLVFMDEPKGGFAGIPMQDVSVAIVDAAGNLTDSQAPVTLHLQGGSAGARLLGATTRNASLGVATFTDLTIDKDGSGYTLYATAGDLVAATSAPFGIEDPTGGPCPTGYEKCDGACVDLSSNPFHCGSCNVSCGGFACEDSVCQAYCPEGMDLCDGTCVDRLTDVENCGTCGNTCEEEESCLQGSCMPTPDREWANWPLPPDDPTHYRVTEEFVEDEITGLVWQRQVLTGGSFTWAAANDYCQRLRIAGRADWRLPTVIELLSIVHTGVTGPTISRGAFPSTPSTNFWSATERFNSTTDAWYVSFSNGQTGTGAKTSAYAVRCVRGGSDVEGDRYVIEDETVYDNKTRLTWQRVASTADFLWADAAAHCENLALDGYDDWRLPTKKELESLIDRRKGSPMLDTEAFPGVGSWYYWTGSGYPKTSTSTYWRVYFSTGVSSTVSITSSSPPRYKVRCVRDDEPQPIACAPGTSYCGDTCVDFQSDDNHCGGCNLRCGAGERCVIGMCTAEDSFDGSYWPLPPESPSEYVDTGDTVIDQVTGLEWEKNVIGATFSWNDAHAYCRSLGTGGHDDWRMPSVSELLSLIDSSRGSPTINVEFFPGTFGQAYWSSTVRRNGPTDAWYVNFGNGTTGTSAQTTAYRIRCVRGGTPAPKKLYDIFEDTVVDRMTGLMWQRVAQTATFLFHDAEAYCSTLGVGGYTDWRVPTKKELESLVDRRLASPSHYRQAFSGGGSSYYWTSTMQASGTTNAWRVQFTEGASSTVAVSGTSAGNHYVRCVRTPVDEPVTCDAGFQACGSYCADLDTDPRNCGVCGGHCGDGEVCDGGICVPEPDREMATWPLPTESPTGYVTTEETVRDPVTELVWQRNLLSNATLNRTQAERYCKELKLEGYADWRLPTLIELLSLVNSSVGSPAIDTTAFPGTPSTNFWSSTVRANNTSYGWIVNFSRGTTETTALTNANRVRCVRGGKTASGQRYQVVRETVRDLETGLIWQQVAQSATMRYEDAEAYCSTLGVGGYTDWRLPTKKELESLINPRTYSPAFTRDVFSGASNHYWTSTPYSASAQWHVYFTEGASGSSSISGTNVASIYVRCVRDPAPPPECGPEESLCGDVCMRLDSDPRACGSCQIACGDGEFCDGGYCAELPDYDQPTWPAPSESPRLSDYDIGTETVTDLQTGLMWQRTMMPGALFTWQQARDYCANIKLDGYGDWRLPSLIELSTLLNLSATSPAINHAVFEGTPNADLWTGTLRADNASYAWFVNFSSGVTGTATLGTGKAARCVRGGSGWNAGPRFLEGQGTVSDVNTGLVWQQSVLPVPMQYAEAEAFCADLGAGGYEDWRLPTLKELLSLVDPSRSSPALDTTLFPGTGSNWTFWSSTTSASSATSYWGVSFQYGVTGTAGQTSTRYVRCVREAASPPATCETGFQACGDTCHDLQSDPLHCGSCGNSCEQGEICGAGACVPAPDTRYALWPLPPPRPVDYKVEDDYVIDEVTGLYWQRNVYGRNMFNWDTAQAYCRMLRIGGYADWRLPTVMELLTLVDEGREAPAWNPMVFGLDLPQGAFWSSVVYQGRTSDAWYVNIATGAPATTSRSTAYLARCVRGGPPEGPLPYVVSHDQVEDPNTGLIWQRRILPSATNWEDGNTACQAEGMRLPTKKELESLVDWGRYNPALDITEGPDAAAVFQGAGNTWSSSESAAGTSRWYLNFTSGASSTAAPTANYNVRCVKNAP